MEKAHKGSPIALPDYTGEGPARGDTARWRLTVRGIVQGVGFRPFAYRLARDHGLAGTVANTGCGVVIEIEGPLPNLKAFLHRLQADSPPLARMTSIHKEAIAAHLDLSEFRILESDSGGKRTAHISPDVATCPGCRNEVFDPCDRRYRYPFTNCTACGPRVTIIEAVPYDRPLTSMKAFPMCRDCSQEYHDPADRRFHAEPNACPVCGPRLSWHVSSGDRISVSDPIAEAARALKEGAVVAVRGLGGFHLAADATSQSAVGRLRRRKRRRVKPLAVMVKDLAAARRLARVSHEEAALLTSPEGPVVLLVREAGVRLATNVAPNVRDVGIMLPHTPLHHLLFAEEDAPPALVMTSGNLSGEPICAGNTEALERLAGIADFFLLHDREIVTRVDDSVARVAGGRLRLLRRARGYAPRPMAVTWRLPSLLACGADLKNTFCLTRGKEAFFSQHIGDLKELATLNHFEESVEHYAALLEISPKGVVHDLHPDYASTQYALRCPLPRKAVQHHHAHAVSVMAEHGLIGPVLALILDGAGYGGDGTVWGGEVLLASAYRFQRLARLAHVPLPGGDSAVREPWRMGLALLWTILGPDALEEACLPPFMRALPWRERQVVVEMMATGFNSPLTSSCGRLFDAAAAILGLAHLSDYEGQAAMELESLAWEAHSGGQKWWAGRENHWGRDANLRREGGLWIADVKGPALGLLADVRGGVSPPVIAYRFHAWLVRSLTSICKRLSGETGVKTVVLGGGCFQNMLLLDGLLEGLTEAGLVVYVGEEVPVNDGGLSLGQSVVGGNLLGGAVS